MAPLAAMFAEPFFAKVFDLLGVDTENWATPVVLTLTSFFSGYYFRYFAFGMMGFGLGLLVFWLMEWREQQSRARLQKTQEYLNIREVYEGDHEELMLFVVNNILPTCDKLYGIQCEIVRESISNEAAEEFAIRGLLNYWGVEKFGAAFDRLSDISSSPSEFIPFQEMEICVGEIERNYCFFAMQANRLARDSKIICLYHAPTVSLYESWRARHNALVEAYEVIKKNSRMGTLFRPTRKSRWGRPVGTANLTLENQFLSPDTVEN